jgi:hypothetical protein
MGVLLFNFYGYRLMIGYMQHQHDALMNARLEHGQYSDADLRSIKIAIPLPYLSSSPDWERVQGSIEIEGVTYEYVKRRVLRDTLEILCLPNRARTHLQSAETEFFRLQLQGTASQQDKQPTTIKITLPDYCQEISSFALAGLAGTRCQHFRPLTCSPLRGYPSRDGHPPRSMPLWT